MTLLPMWPEEFQGPRLEFVPQWSSDAMPGDVKGMSGGPAVVLFRDCAFWFGVQSERLGVDEKRPSRLFVAQSARLIPMLEWIHTHWRDADVE